MKKKTIAITSTFVLCMTNCIAPAINAHAEVWTPEIIKTETWTANYYIDPDKDTTLYPYIECRADIYNDGHIDFIAYNTHEFDGFATVSHKVQTEWTLPYATDTNEYKAAKNNVTVTAQGTKFYVYNNNYLMECNYSMSNMSYYPEDYYGSRLDYSGWGNIGFSSTTYIINGYEYVYFTGAEAEFAVYSGALPNFSYNETELNRNNFSGWYPKCVLCAYKFTPNVEIEKEYKFVLFGHELVITPELLKEPVKPNTNIDTRTKEELLAENEELKAENEQLKAENTALKQELQELKDAYTTLEQKYNTLQSNYTQMETVMKSMIEDTNKKLSEIEELQSKIGNPRYADFNKDEKVTVGDAVIFMRWLASTPDMRLNGDYLIPEKWYEENMTDSNEEA